MFLEQPQRGNVRFDVLRAVWRDAAGTVSNAVNELIMDLLRSPVHTAVMRATRQAVRTQNET